mgnify:CR=1 FL=1
MRKFCSLIIGRVSANPLSRSLSQSRSRFPNPISDSNPESQTIPKSNLCRSLNHLPQVLVGQIPSPWPTSPQPVHLLSTCLARAQATERERALALFFLSLSLCSLFLPTQILPPPFKIAPPVASRARAMVADHPTSAAVSPGAADTMPCRLVPHRAKPATAVIPPGPAL